MGMTVKFVWQFSDEKTFETNCASQNPIAAFEIDLLIFTFIVLVPLITDTRGWQFYLQIEINETFPPVLLM